MNVPGVLRPARVRVPGSTSNLGAGFDCLGLALNRYLTATYEPAPTTALEVRRYGTLAALDLGPDEDILVRAFRARIRGERGIEPGGVLRVESQIPIGRGLGSSAAALIAGLGLASAALRAGRFDRAATLWEVDAEEGHPDNGAPSLFGGLVGVTRGGTGRPRAFRLPLSNRIGLAFAAPGHEVRTRAARAVLPAQVPFTDVAAGLGRLAALVRGLATGDPELIGLGMTDRLHVPHRLELIPGAAEAIAAARAAGAWGVTISGSGSGLIAACAPDRASAIADAMASAFHGTAAGEGATAFAARPDRHGTLCREAAQ
ncbi:MAG TPA: homoserine kinase [Longimicrobiales bacterium]